MSWLADPRFVPTRDSILASLKSKQLQFRKMKPVIFLCGGANSLPRERLAQYLRHHLDALVFFAEEVWEVIANQPGMNALQMEEQLARLADAVIIIVESPGTFAELGAFSLSESLRSKLLPILDRRYLGGNSFIETGPIRWVNADSQFAPSIWVNLASVLDAAEEIGTRLDRLAESVSSVVEDLAESQKHQLFFLCDLVAVFGPCPADHIDHYMAELVGDRRSSTIFLLGLALALDLVCITPSGDKYYRPVRDGILKSFHRTPKYLDIPSLRARALSALLRIPAGTAALSEMARHDAA